MNPQNPQHPVWAYRPAEGAGAGVEGPLEGLSFSVKDLYGVPGWPLRASTPAPLPPVEGSPLVARLRGLGARLTGKTQLHEIALGISGDNPFGGTPNPLDPARMSGGSSSGAAASLYGEGAVDFALGTDTGGSIRIPAAWCGVVGFKPTKGSPLWPTEGVLPLSPSCDHAGPLARGLATVVRVQRALGGEVPDTACWEGLRVGVWNPPGWTDAEVHSALETVRARLEAAGATTAGVGLPDMRAAYGDIVQSEAAQVHAGALQLDEPGFGAGTLALLRRGARLSGGEVQAARRQREAYRAELERLFQGADVLLAPAVPCAAPLRGSEEVRLLSGGMNGAGGADSGAGATPLRQAVLRLTVPFSLLGVPVLALPLPVALPGAEGPADGLSVGVQLVAPWGQDGRLLALAGALGGW